jgi:hypothetical protein
MPPAQATTHPPSKHAAPDEHVVPQPPQLLGSELRFAHAEASPALHWLRGAAHTVWHEPPEHTVPLAHTLPQDPQLALSVCTLAQ